ncbi:hypothetical protein B0A53_04479 [Rhodotorula sp. CCFEE 5036]|nr:hypothetical protein B0A53_04479 [Rhodotorula sp. CCFEE 5036]
MRIAAFPAGPGRPGPGEIVFTAAHDTAAEPVARSEVCYSNLYAFEDQMALRYSKEHLAEDESDRGVSINDGYKKDADGRQFYYIEHCYRSGHLQSEVSTDLVDFSDVLSMGSLAVGAGNLDVGAGLEKSAFGFGRNPRLVFGTSGRSLFKRQNGTAQDDNSALDDLNRVSEAIGGSENVLALSSSNDDASLQPPAGSSMGDDGTAEGAAPEGVFGQDSPLGMGFGGKGKAVEETQSDFNWPKDLQALDGPTAALGADPFFTTPSVFVPATPSLGPAPGSQSPTSPVGTLGTGAPASLSSSPLTVYSSSTSLPTSGSLFVTVAGAPSPTGSVTTIVH